MTFVRALSFRRAVVALAALALGTVGQAKADIVIDDFTTPDPGVAYSLGAAVPSVYTQVDGNRTLTVTQTQNSFALANQTSGVIGNTALGGRFVLNTTTGTTAYASLAYTYAGLDLSAGGTILNFSFTSTDLGVPFSVIVGDGTTSATQVGLVTTPTNLSFDLTGFAGVNLAGVTQIELVLNQNVNTLVSTASADFSIANVTITEPPPPTTDVPAPPAVLLALAALPVLGLRRKWLKKA